MTAEARRKRALRRVLIPERDAVPPEVRAELSRRIVAAVRAELASLRPGGVLLCVPLGSEPDLAPLYEEPSPDRAPYLARSRWSERDLDACPYPCPLETTSWGLRQPGAEAPSLERASLERVIAAVVVPGVAFARETRLRLGYGGGFFDRFRARFPGVRAIGACFAAQIVDDIPHGPLDLPMDMIVTEDGPL